jgi:uncharacterized protein (TIGR00255 family)
MTGFGRGEASSAGFQATVEARSVNNRFCEVRLRLPRALNGYENKAQAMVKKRLPRGKIDISVQFQLTEEADLGLKVNSPVARAYTHLLSDLLEATKIDDKVRLEHLIQFSDVFDKEGEENTVSEEAWIVLREALNQALDELDKMRAQEGRAMRADLLSRLLRLREELAQIEDRAPLRIDEGRQRLHQRLAEVFDDERIDTERLELEVALLADRLDVSEECVRLHSHFEQFEQALNSEEPVGRRLNFLTQEINREVNTIGSKANDGDIATRVITMKELLEQVREQVSNVQ